jgi:arsenate reductase
MVTVCADAEEKCPRVFPGMGQRLHWGFEDPAAFVGSEEETLSKFRGIRDQIEERIKVWAAELDGAASNLGVVSNKEQGGRRSRHAASDSAS